MLQIDLNMVKQYCFMNKWCVSVYLTAKDRVTWMETQAIQGPTATPIKKKKKAFDPKIALCVSRTEASVIQPWLSCSDET